MEETRHCRLCAAGIDGVLSLGHQSVSSFLQPGESARYAPIELGVCPGCGLAQLLATCPGEWLYDWYGYRSGTNESMRTALRELAQATAARVELKAGEYVLDIGSNDGTLLRDMPHGVVKVGFDPAKNLGPEASRGLDMFVNGYFSAEALKEWHFKHGPFKAVTSAAMFYDLDDPIAFCRDVRKVLAPDGVFVVQMNYLGTMLERNGYDNLVHEHLTYFSLTTFSKVLRAAGLYVRGVEENDVNGGSFRAYCGTEPAEPESPGALQVADMLGREERAKLGDRATFRAFAERVRRTRDDLRLAVDSATKKGKKIYVYGASTRGLVIVEYCGLDSRVIAGAAERNPDKWGRTFAGTGIPCVPEEEARAKADYFLVLPHHFLAEFLEREDDWLRRGGHFIVPLPEVRVLGPGGVPFEARDLTPAQTGG